MKNKHWTLIGGSYIVFALAIATLATYQTSPSFTTDRPTLVAQAPENPVWRSERLYQSDENPRRDLFLTIWTTRNCRACVIQEGEIPALEEAGYNVVLRRVPAPRWVKSFPTTVVTRDSSGGKEVTRYSGARTLAEIDEILKIGETPEDEDIEEEEDPEYDIFSPKGDFYWKPEWYALHVREILTKKQVGEVEALREMGFEIIPTGSDGDYRLFPVAVLIDKRDNTCIKAWFVPFFVEDVLDAIPMPEPCDVKAQVNTFNLIVWLDGSEESNRQYDEIAKLRKLGFSANVYVVGGPKKPPRLVTNFPTVILIDNRRGGGVYVWLHFVDATTIRHTANKRT